MGDKSQSMSHERILIVISDQEKGKLLERGALRPAGYKVTIAADQREAIIQIKASLPDLVILDENLPDGSGMEFARKLLDEHPAMQIILIAEIGSSTLPDEALQIGLADCLYPPMTPNNVLKAVQQGLQRGAKLHNWLTNSAGHHKDSLRQRVDALETLSQVARSVTASLDLDYVLTAVVDAAVKMTGAEEGSLLLLDDQSGELYMRAARNFQEDFVRTFRLPINDTMAGEVIRTGKPFILDPGTPEKIKTSYLVRTLIYVPLEVHGRVIGVLGVDNRLGEQIFSEDQLTLVSTLADHAAIAIENARLYSNSELERQKLETILTGIGDGVIVIGTDSRVILINTPAREAFGIGDEEISLKPVSEVFKHQDLLELISRDGDGPCFQCEFSLDDGRVMNAQIATIPDVGRAITMQDITHLKELDRIKTDFVNTVSHDLRSPLTAILGYVELIGRAGPVSDLQQDFIHRIQVSVRNITVLINDLLDLGRIETGFDARKEIVPLPAIVNYSVGELRNRIAKKDLTLNLDLPDDLPNVFGDPVRLRQVVDNLLENAIQYTPAEGAISIRIFAEKGQVILQIEDDGPGIPAADQPYIFDKFYRASNISTDLLGSGLGLAIVKSIVENHQGRVWVDSILGKGSTFTVVLPIEKEEE
jgi:two-component system NtrC family sensor kinase